MLSYRGHLECAFEYYQERYLDKNRKRKRTSLGDQRLETLRKLLDSMGLERSPMQKQFHENFISTTLAKIYSKDTNVDLSAIAERENFANLKQCTVCSTPRRFGKTTSVAMFAGAFAMSLESEISIFSTGRRASAKLLAQIAKLIKSAGGEDRIVRCNQEQLFLRTEGGISQISSYPAGTSTLRGVGGDLLILEEAGFMSEELFLQVVVPLLEMQKTSLLAISTIPPGRDCFFNNMLTLEEDGELVFNVLQVRLVCDVCLKEGRTECSHVDTLPPWKADRLSFVKKLYGDREDLLKRESLGLSAMDPRSIFKEPWVDRAWSHLSHPSPRTLFISYDPCGGGESEFGIVSICLERGQVHILGAEAERGKSAPEIFARLLGHARTLRKRWGDLPIVFVPESNLGLESAHAYHFLKSKLPRFRCISEGRVGVCTTHQRKVEMAKGLECLFLKDAISMTSRFYTETGAGKKLRAQLLNYKRIRRDSCLGRSSLVFTGKDTGNDDLAMAFQIACFWAERCTFGKASFV